LPKRALRAGELCGKLPERIVSVAVIVTVGVNTDGQREVLGLRGALDPDPVTRGLFEACAPFWVRTVDTPGCALQRKPKKPAMNKTMTTSPTSQMIRFM
jgi:hypothetical protein